MTNKEKAREIGDLCPSCLNDGINGCSECERAGKYFGALQMAEWKDQQFKEYLDKKRCEWKGGEDSYHHSIKARILSEIINELFKEEQK